MVRPGPSTWAIPKSSMAFTAPQPPVTEQNLPAHFHVYLDGLLPPTLRVFRQPQQNILQPTDSGSCYAVTALELAVEAERTGTPPKQPPKSKAIALAQQGKNPYPEPQPQDISRGRGQGQVPRRRSPSPPHGRGRGATRGKDRSRSLQRHGFGRGREILVSEPEPTRPGNSGQVSFSREPEAVSSSH